MRAIAASRAAADEPENSRDITGLECRSGCWRRGGFGAKQRRRRQLLLAWDRAVDADDLQLGGATCGAGPLRSNIGRSECEQASLP